MSYAIEGPERARAPAARLPVAARRRIEVPVFVIVDDLGVMPRHVGRDLVTTRSDFVDGEGLPVWSGAV